MADESRIPVPWTQRWRRLRNRALPLLTFSACAVLMGWLWSRHAGSPNATGEVHVVRVDVTSAVDGTLTALPGRQWTLFDAVQANQIVARLDEQPTLAALRAMTKDVAQLQAQLDATTAQLQTEYAERRHDHLAEATRLAEQIERYSLDLLDRETAQAVDRVELQRLNERLTSVRQLRKESVATDLELFEAQLERDIVAKRIEASEQALKELEVQKKQAADRMEKLPAPAQARIAKALAPIRAAIEAGEARVEELNAQAAALQIHAPIAGTITAIHRWPGQAVHARPDSPILTIAADQGQYILAYVRQDQRIEPAARMPVDVRPHATSIPPRRTFVEQVGPQYEPVPLHQLRNPQIPEWGLAVRIAMPSDIALRPGELVDITFRPTP